MVVMSFCRNRFRILVLMNSKLPNKKKNLVSFRTLSKDFFKNSRRHEDFAAECFG